MLGKGNVPSNTTMTQLCTLFTFEHLSYSSNVYESSLYSQRALGSHTRFSKQIPKFCPGHASSTSPDMFWSQRRLYHGRYAREVFADKLLEVCN